MGASLCERGNCLGGGADDFWPGEGWKAGSFLGELVYQWGEDGAL